MTKRSTSRFSGSAPTAAISPACSTIIGVSIMRPELGLFRRVDRLQDLGRADDVAGMSHLGQQDGIRPGRRSAGQQSAVPRAVSSALGRMTTSRRPIAAFTHRFRHLFPSPSPWPRARPNLEIEDDGVSRQRARLFQRPVIGASAYGERCVWDGFFAWLSSARARCCMATLMQEASRTNETLA